jgi:hypothetical protein
LRRGISIEVIDQTKILRRAEIMSIALILDYRKSELEISKIRAKNRVVN